MSRHYYYERKPRMFKDKDLDKNAKKKVISNEKVGQAYLAIAEQQPAIAMAQRSKIWTDPYYKKIFCNSSLEDLLLCYLIYSYCFERRRQYVNLGGLDDAITKYGSFHMARIIGSLLLGEDWNKRIGEDKEHLKERQSLKEQLIKNLERDFTFLDQKYKEAQVILKKVVEDLTNKDLSQVINVFKSSDIQQKLDNVLIKEVG